MKTLANIQNELRELVPQGADIALDAIKAALIPGTDTYNDFLMLEGRYQDASKQLVQGVISDEDATLKFNQIRQMILEFIDSLQEADLQGIAKSEAYQSGMADVYNGELLYRIPKKMAVGVEEECVVRMAFDRQKLLDRFEVQPGDVMKDLRVGEVMAVELLDPDADKAFSITTVHDTVQFLEKDLVTEWIFCVTPLMEGSHQLVLKISIIEIINGLERKRNEVLREEVDILTTLDPATKAAEFTPTGITWQLTASNEQRAVPGGAAGGSELPPMPASPSPAVSPSPSPMPQSPTVAPRSGGNFRKIGTALGAVAALIFAVWAMRGNLFNNNKLDIPTEVVDNNDPEWDGIRKRRSKQELEEFVNKYPGTNESAQALNILDTLENEAWANVVAANEQAAYEKYLEEYPNGKYRVDAIRELEAIAKTKDENFETHANDEAPKPQPGEKPKTEQIAKPKKPAPKQKPPTSKPKPGTPPKTDSSTKPTQQPGKQPVKPTDPNAPVPVKSVARKPVFKGCDNSDRAKEEKCTSEKVYKFLRNGFRYPQEAIDKSIEGTVNVSFVVERDGSITDVKATNKLGGGCEEEAVRLVKKLPRFQPGLNAKGDPVRVLYTQPVRFELE